MIEMISNIEHRHSEKWERVLHEPETERYLWKVGKQEAMISCGSTKVGGAVSKVQADAVGLQGRGESI